MKNVASRVALIALCGLLPAALSAQSLGDVAAKEQKKKEGQKPKPVKVYTDEDLKKARESDKSSVTILGATPDSESSESSAGETRKAIAEDVQDDAPKKRERWRERADGARAEIKAAEASVTQIQARINALAQDTEPNPTDALDPNRLQKREAEKQKATQDLNQAKEALAGAKKAYEDLEAEARRNGVPLGWLEP
jgi:hypothetical protein